MECPYSTTSQRSDVKLLLNMLEEENNGIKIQDGKMEECTSKVNELNNTEIELPKIKFTLEELKPYNFSVIDMAKIDELIQE